MEKITLIAISGSSKAEDFIAHYKAIQKSILGLNFGAVKILSPIRPIEIDENIQYIKIPELTLAGYNFFSIRHLNSYVDTEYILRIEADGYVLHPELWDNRFFDYDYIGAPWPIANGHFNGVRVGNGGFTLRSKKFLEICQRDVPANGFNEDHLVCVTYRSIFLNKGIRYAPLEIAAKFSVEGKLEDYEVSAEHSFGAHGKWLL